ncbi:hypothetical protein PP7435_CHR4-0363 [Komagataella phaffii CBS 7435]|uniref:Uncharacterized protein n=2 Tax=Komagataella phaffii TaxID=460519 RepID=C4R8E2_KOMPG|nr:uncharacterized protein PAS_chr4_0607 [Komagataella phaffii GS115]CAH2450732.1 Hypothetical protein BQ9382_C4-1885 [Komagataella phaffii CBS 7435]CAY71867.1 Putative protein of unknown function, conserved in fungi [Komagataella phaffii GS115]CCA40531.1 hypothetical protein PP7435_CHR4-0363 [Komagataella phaffii CBS 7435]
MKPVVTPAKAWFCTVISAFGVVILGVIGTLFKHNHETVMGSINDPEDGAAVAKTVYGAALLYLAFFVFCGAQLFFISRQPSIQL